MPTEHNLLILHLSDLHFGNHNRFADRDVAKLGKAFYRAVDRARTEAAIPAPVQLVIVSGDVAETADEVEYEQAWQFFDALSGEIGLDHTRFVFAPGNHDVSWPLCEMETIQQKLKKFSNDELRRSMDGVKFQFYEALLARIYGTPLADVPGRRPLAAGGWRHNFPELRLSVAALNTSELESHRTEDHRGHLSQQQAEALMDTWRRDPYTGWLKIVVVHHNPIPPTLSNIEGWTKFMKSQPGMAAERIDHYAADVVGFEGRELLERIVRDCRAHLVLHGHHHDQGEPIEWPWSKDGRAPVLSTGSWGLIAGKLPGDAPPACQLLLLTPNGAQPRQEAYPLVYNGRFRLEGDLLPGNFVADPADRGRYSQPLHLPAGWLPEASPPAATSELSQAAAAFVRRYRQRTGSLFEQWDLRYAGVAQGGGPARPIDTRLDDIYQPLRLAEGFYPAKTDRGRVLSVSTILHMVAWVTSEPPPTSKVPGAADGTPARGGVFVTYPLTIRGSAGSGKTTWMRYTFRRLLEQDGALPLLITLRDVARRWNDPECQGAARSIDAVLDAWVAEHLGRGWEGHLTELLEAARTGMGPRLVLLVDGWDELGPLGVEFREKLLGFHRSHRQVQVIVSSRPYGEGRPTSTDGFLILDIQPLSTAEIDAFAERFFGLCYRANQDMCRQEATRFRAALDRSPDASVLAQNALLLTMMLLISRSEQLPDKRHLLYDRCLYNLLTALPNRREEAGVLLSEYQWRPDDSEIRQQVAAALAFGIQSAGYQKQGRSAIVLRWDEMIALLPSGWNRQQQEGFLSWLGGPAGVLIDRADGTIVFAHLSFQEFLAAWHLNATVVAPDEVAEQFVALGENTDWWETLLLWAAMISGQNAERLSPVTAGLLKQRSGTSLVGMMVADGTGNDAMSDTWTQRSSELLQYKTPDRWERCRDAWTASRQDGRKEKLYQALAVQSQKAGWVGWRRLDGLREYIREKAELPPPENAAAAGVIMALRDSPAEQAFAAGRILCGAMPLWPGNSSGAGWLQVWPSHRRLAGLRLQQAIACGAPREDVSRLARWELPAPLWTEEDREWARECVRYYTSDFLCNLQRDWDRDWNRDWVPYLTRYFGRDSDRTLARGQDTDLFRYFGQRGCQLRDWVCDLDRFWGLFWAARWTRLCGLSAVPVWSIGTWELSFDRPLARRQVPAWTLDFATVEHLSFGRPLARSTMAAEQSDCPLRRACRLSLRPETITGGDVEALRKGADGSDPLWPALGRHLARRSTDQDRGLLIDLAQHPEKREPPLRWGLQYIVRGDLLMADGSVLTLDELADEVGLPHLPYLDEMEPEIELD